MSFRRVVGADAVALVAALLRGEDDRWPIFLLGAGASFRSGVPTATDAVKQIARIVYSERKLQGARPPERVRPDGMGAMAAGAHVVQSSRHELS